MNINMKLRIGMMKLNLTLKVMIHMMIHINMIRGRKFIIDTKRNHKKVPRRRVGVIGRVEEG